MLVLCLFQWDLAVVSSRSKGHQERTPVVETATVYWLGISNSGFYFIFYEYQTHTHTLTFVQSRTHTHTLREKPWTLWHIDLDIRLHIGHKHAKTHTLPVQTYKHTHHYNQHHHHHGHYINHYYCYIYPPPSSKYSSTNTHPTTQPHHYTLR